MRTCSRVRRGRCADFARSRSESRSLGTDMTNLSRDQSMKSPQREACGRVSYLVPVGGRETAAATLVPLATAAGATSVSPGMSSLTVDSRHISAVTRPAVAACTARQMSTEARWDSPAINARRVGQLIAFSAQKTGTEIPRSRRYRSVSRAPSDRGPRTFRRISPRMGLITDVRFRTRQVWRQKKVGCPCLR